jgi:hypothetical protein
MSRYPAIAAGQRITTNLLNAMIPVVIDKPSATSRSSTTTVADDPDLTYTLGANGMYLVEFYIKYSTPGPSGTAGFKTQWTVPSGASGNRTCMGPGSSQNDGGADNISMHSGVHGYTTAETYGSRGTSTNQLLAIETSIVTTTSSGACALQWAQQTSNASATSVAVDSFMRIVQLA